jgi:hypothetical protein
MVDSGLAIIPDSECPRSDRFYIHYRFHRRIRLTRAGATPLAAGASRIPRISLAELGVPARDNHGFSGVADSQVGLADQEWSAVRGCPSLPLAGHVAVTVAVTLRPG